MADRQEQTYHLINRFIKGELIGRELDNFKAQLKDPEFAAQVKLQEQIVKAVEQVRSEELKAVIKDASKVRYMQNEWGNKWTYASAAIVILFVSAFFVFKFFVDGESTNPVAVEERSDSLEVQQTEEAPIEIDTTALAIATPPPSTVPELEIVEEDLVLDEEATDGDDDFVELIEEAEVADVPVNADIEADRLSTTRAGDEILVKSEELISKSQYSVRVLSYKNTGAEKRVDTTDAEAAGVEDDYSAGYSSSRNLSVEFWKSPVRFTGYQYTNSGVKIYEWTAADVSGFVELEDHLYIQKGDVFYFLKKNNNYNKFAPVTNSTLIKVLNENN